MCIRYARNSNPNDPNTQPYARPTNLIQQDIHSCNKSAQDTAVAWKTVMDTFPTSSLVSPATAGFGVFFFDDFFGNCTALYGPGGCRISAIAAHDYDCNPTSTLEYLRFLSERYSLPIWLTEFSCGDGKEDSPMSAQLSFMQLIFPMLEAAPFIERVRFNAHHAAPVRCARKRP